MNDITPKSVGLLDQAILLGQEGNPEEFEVWREQSRASLRVAFGEGDAMVKRFDGISYSLSVWTTGTPDSAFEKARRSGVRKGLALLQSARTIVEAESHKAPDDGISSLPGSLHPWVLTPAAAFWDQGAL